LLSDHGQSQGATFRQRHGQTLRQLINMLTRGDLQVGEAAIIDAGHSFVEALIAELNAASQQLHKQRIRRVTMAATARTLKGMEQQALQPQRRGKEQDDIVVCVSGNLAHIYFNTIGERRATLSEIAAQHPGLVDALVKHPGIGFVVGLGDDGHALLLGKYGARDLNSGAITGQDPLLPFAGEDAGRRAAQLLRLAQFESAGDLILNSAIYPDGSVASFEELVGSHGGLGGEQTHAFILYPGARSLDGHSITNTTSRRQAIHYTTSGGQAMAATKATKKPAVKKPTSKKKTSNKSTSAKKTTTKKPATKKATTKRTTTRPRKPAAPAPESTPELEVVPEPEPVG